ncbi:MAG: hypothetical protein U9R16_06135 [Campylobacterota bacterium]|nr:hypothetical protein [Campylobacterota bacterium]
MKFLKYIALVVVFNIALLAFLPKQNLYYALEKQLEKYDVIISDEKFKSSMFGFTLNDASLYFKGVDLATLDKVNISFSKIDISSKELGYAKTSFDIFNRSVTVDFEPTRTFIKKYKIIKKYFKKQENGVYRYEYKLF